MAKKRSILEAGITSLGGGLGTVAGAVAGVGLGEVAGMAVAPLAGAVVGTILFDGLGRLVPETLRAPSVPRLKRVNGLFRLLGPGDCLLHQKLSVDFALSPLFDRARIAAARDDILVKASATGAVPARFKEDCLALEQRYPHIGRPLGALRCQSAANRLRGGRHPLSVICLAIQPAIMATLFDMRDRLKIPMSIDHGSANGVLAVDRIESHMTAGVPFDMAFMPNAAFLMARKDGTCLDLPRRYSFLMPVHAQEQHVIRPRGVDQVGLHGINFMRFLGNGSAEEQFRGMHKGLDVALREQPYDAHDYKALVDNMEGNIAAVLWDPWHSWVMRSGAFVSLPSFDYQYWMSLYALRESLGGPSVARDFVMVFRESWAFCQARIDYCFHLLEANLAKGDFLRAMKYD